jgi:prepilin-type N-terminal cleavage/methylation domain-containing protein
VSGPNFSPDTAVKAENKPLRPALKKKAGFSLMELVVVIAIMGILIGLAVPSLMQQVPRSRLNTESQRMGTFLRQARLKAANTQKPIRVAINCIGHFATPDDNIPCSAKMETAIYSDGVMDSWGPVRDGLIELNAKINIQARTVRDPGTGNWSPTPGSSLNNNLIWVVFLPSGQVLSSFGPPINISLWYETIAEESASWEVNLNTASGRISITERS